MYRIERKSEILKLSEVDGEVNVNELSKRFGVSKETIRRDLTELEGEGIITRTHGGGLFNKLSLNSFTEYPVGIRSIKESKEKNLICREAVKHIEENDIIFIDNSSTTSFIIQYIPKNISITILTNSIKLLIESVKTENKLLKIICFGGIFKESNLSIYGNTTLKNANEYFPNKAFLSCAGIRSDGLMTDSSLDEVETKKMMLENAHQVYFLIDHTKFFKTGQVTLGKLSRNFVVITDSDIDLNKISPLNNIGTQFILAE